MSDFSFYEAVLLLGLMLALGGVAGLLAGLLGVGGGIILVPGLYFIFGTLGYSQEILMHCAVGTSLAVIIPTGVSSAWAHWKKGAVRLELVRKIGIGIVAGVVIGLLIADSISGPSLQLLFAVVLAIFAGLMQIDSSKIHFRNDLPPQPWTGLIGVLMGTFSTLMGIGGATMSVPFMSLNGISIHRSVGTAAALGPLIAIPGALGFVFMGGPETGLLPLSLGYVSVLALCVISPMSAFVAPMGVHLAHRFSVTALRRIFSGFMIIVAAKMLYGAFYG